MCTGEARKDTCKLGTRRLALPLVLAAGAFDDVACRYAARAAAVCPSVTLSRAAGLVKLDSLLMSMRPDTTCTAEVAGLWERACK